MIKSIFSIEILLVVWWTIPAKNSSRYPLFAQMIIPCYVTCTSAESCFALGFFSSPHTLRKWAIPFLSSIRGHQVLGRWEDAESGGWRAQKGHFSAQVDLPTPPGLKKRPGCVITVPKSPHRPRGLLGCPKKKETPRCFCSGVIMTSNLKSAKSCIDSVIWNIIE